LRGNEGGRRLTECGVGVKMGRLEDVTVLRGFTDWPGLVDISVVERWDAGGGMADEAGGGIWADEDEGVELVFEVVEIRGFDTVGLLGVFVDEAGITV
jgi:hypothetical protein